MNILQCFNFFMRVQVWNEIRLFFYVKICKNYLLLLKTQINFKHVSFFTSHKFLRQFFNIISLKKSMTLCHNLFKTCISLLELLNRPKI